MKLTVTFKDIVAYADNKTIEAVERVVGSRQVYGMDTPIDLGNLIEAAGLVTVCNLLPFTQEPNVDLQKNIAIELVRSNIFIWDSLMDGSGQVVRLMDYCDSYMSAPVSEEEQRRDYCGDLIPGSGAANWLDRIKAQSAIVEGLIDAIDTSHSPTVHHSYYMGNGAPFTEAMLDDWDRLGNGRWTIDREHSNVIDPVANTYNPGDIEDYNPTLMLDKLLTDDPDAILKQSQEFDNVVVHGYTSYAALVRVNVDQSNGTQTNRAAEGVKMLGYAALRCAYMVRSNVGSLGAVVALIRSARTLYVAGARYPLAAKLARFRELGMTGRYVNTYSSDPAIAQAENAVFKAGEDLRVANMRDPEWVNAQDSDRDGKLSLAERKNMELTMRKAIRDTRKTAAKTLYAETETALANLSSMDTEKPLVDIIHPYLL